MRNRIIYAIACLAIFFVGIYAGLTKDTESVAKPASVRQENIEYKVVPVDEPKVLQVKEVPQIEEISYEVSQPEEVPYTTEELEILALIIYQEAGADFCSDTTRQMVGEVFLNRVASPYYPDTFYEVATQESQYGRLCWTGVEWPARASSPEESYAVERAYNAAEDLLAETAVRLLPEDTIFQAEFEQGSEIVAHQDGIYFCK